jgi:hypothetical protein
VFEELTEEELLKRCVGGYDTNVNENFNGVIWTKVPKTVFVGIDSLRVGVYEAVITFNEGAVGRLKVLDKLGLEYSNETKLRFEQISYERKKQFDRRQTEKQKRRSTKLTAEDTAEYLPGGF